MVGLRGKAAQEFVELGFEAARGAGAFDDRFHHPVRMGLQRGIGDHLHQRPKAEHVAKERTGRGRLGNSWRRLASFEIGKGIDAEHSKDPHGDE
jgi:hypothetical protein